MSAERSKLEADAGRLRDLHRPGDPLLLVNVWDPETAKRVEAAGALAVATSSAAIAHSLGGRDDNSAGPAAFRSLAAAVGAVGVPVTADLEGGYGLSGSELVDRLLSAGAVGCNIEDTDHSRGDRLLDAEEHATYLAEIRTAAEARRVPIVLNARIDTILRAAQRDATLSIEETLRRARLYIEAGADCIYPIGLRDPDLVKLIINEVGCLINVNPSAPLQALADAGAARVSFGAGPFFFMMAEFESRARAALSGDATAFG
jgi:2-methylisocitrate lyase-like PEP mutase family enzyme